MQIIDLIYNPHGDFWEARSRLRGSTYRVSGPTPMAAFQEMCELLKFTADRWRVRMLGPNAYQCVYSSPDGTLQESVSTVDDIAPIDPSAPPPT